MAHKDMYIKFMLQYLKTNTSLHEQDPTEYEVATVLDKAYNAVIAQKFTGMNNRGASFEVDPKAISDLSPLIVTSEKEMEKTNIATNVYSIRLPKNLLYYVEGYLPESVDNAIDDITDRRVPMLLVSHKIAKNFFATPYNMPWVKNPICYIEYDDTDTMYVVVDSYAQKGKDRELVSYLTYVKKPNTFIKDLSELKSGTRTFFDDGGSDDASYVFELDDSVAEQVISLAVTFMLENTLSPRLNSKLNTRGLEV